MRDSSCGDVTFEDARYPRATLFSATESIPFPYFWGRLELYVGAGRDGPCTCTVSSYGHGYFQSLLNLDSDCSVYYHLHHSLSLFTMMRHTKRSAL